MKNFYTPSNDHKLNTIFVLLIFVFAWVATHPYFGIWHDGILYLGQAFLNINPSIFQDDVFFKYGSQDSYSIFSPLYVFFIKLMGVENAALFLLFFSQIFFISALWLVCTEIYGKIVGAWSTCGLAILSAYYGAESIFSYAETFFTARSIAEPLCLLAIYFLLRQRPWLSAVFLFLAGLFHPLITLPCLCIWWVFQSLNNKKYLYLALFIPLALLLAVSNVQPFNRILEVYDDFWWDVVFVRNNYVLPFEWPIISWVLFATDCCCVYLATRVLQGQARRLMIAALLATLLFMLISIFGTTIFRNVILTSLQLWRIDWLLHFLAMAVIPHFIIILWRKGGLAIYSAAFLVLSGFFYPKLSFLTFLAFSSVLYFLHRRGVNFEGANQRLRRYLNFGVGVVFLFILIQILVDLYVLTSIPAIFEATRQEKFEKTFFDPNIWKLELVFAWILFFIFKKRTHAIVFLLACMLPLSYFWDQRSPWQKYLTSSHIEFHPFRRYVTEHQEIYWHGGTVLNSWSLLNSASYYSKSQGAGALFNRGTAIALYNRAKALGQHQPECFAIQYLPGHGNSKCEPDRAMITKVCVNEQDLDAMVFPFAIQGLPSIPWTFQQPDPTQNKAYFLYPCSIFRKS